MKKAKIYYHDIGDYLTREEKLKIVKDFGSFANMPMTELQPNEHGDWINMRNDSFENYIPFAPEKKFDTKTQSFFIPYSLGIATNKDAWLYNFSENELAKNLEVMISFYNEQRKKFHSQTEIKNAKDFVEYNAQKINWTDMFLNDLSKNIEYIIDENKFCNALYRPYSKQKFCYEKRFVQRTYQQTTIFPTVNHKNLVICLTGIGVSKDFSVVITDVIPDLQIQANGQCFPLYYYEENNATQKGLFDDASTGAASGNYIRREAISDFILERARKQYGVSTSSTSALTKEDIFYYVYGFLHSKEYRETFSNDLKKMLPRLPLVEDVRDFWAFSKSGRKLAELHLNYESVEPSKEVIVMYNPLSISGALSQANKEEMEYLNYKVDKMRFPKKGEKGTIIYNSQISIENIPEKAYNYVVNGKSAIEWIMERYQITTHKDSGITNNPNDWAAEVGNPKYILNLLLSIINVSVQTVEIVEGLPKVSFE